MNAPRLLMGLGLFALMAALPLAAVASETANQTEPARSSPPPESTTVCDGYDPSTGQYHKCDDDPNCVTTKREVRRDDGSYHYEYHRECRYDHHDCATYPDAKPQPSGDEPHQDYHYDGEFHSEPPKDEPASGSAATSPRPDCPHPDRSGDACAEAMRGMEARARDLNERQQRERDALTADWKARYDGSRDARSEEEWKALHAEKEAAWRELNEQHRRQWEAFAAEARGQACAPPPATATPACAAGYRGEEASAFETKVRAEGERLMALLEERRAHFEATLKAEHRDFMARGPSADEQRRFESSMRDRMAAFELEQQATLHDWKQRMQAHYAQHVERASVRCAGVDGPIHGPRPLPATAPPPVKAHYDHYRDGEEKRLAFELELRTAYARFLAEQDAALADFLAGDPDGRAERRFRAEQDAERLRFELDMRERMRAFEAELRDQWRSDVRPEVTKGDHRERFGSFSVAFDEARQRILVTGKYVAFEGDPATQTMGAYDVGGQRVLDGLYASATLESFAFGDAQGGSHLAVEAPGVRMSLHDHPHGLMKLGAHDDATVTLDFADYLDVAEDANGYRLSAEGFEALLRVARGEAKLDEATNAVTLTGRATFLVTSASAPVLDKVANKHRPAVLDAIATGQVAAEVTLVKDGGALSGDTLEFGSVEVAVEATDLERRRATLHIESAEHAGKTIVVNLDRDGFGLDVQLAFYELDAEGGARDAGIVRASSLADVLDASDDGDRAEFWVVVDADGTQVLVSIPHFSAKRLEIQGSATAAAPNVIVVGALLGGGVLAVALVVWSVTSRTPGLGRGRSPPSP